jgi:hypothetical protein
MYQIQEPLKPYYFKNFQCDSCQKEFRQTTAYAYHPSLRITYCANVLKKNKTKHQPVLFANETSKPSNILSVTALFLTKRNNSAVLIIGKSKKDLMNSLKTCQSAARLAEK